MSTVINSFRKIKEVLPMSTGKTLYSSRPSLIDTNPYVTVSDFVVPKQDVSNYKIEETHIVLTRKEMKSAKDIGSDRQYEYEVEPAKNGYTGPGYDMSIAGAGAEIAVAKYFNIFHKAADIRANELAVGRLNIRAAVMAIPTLVLRQHDLTSKYPFILVAKAAPAHFYIVGWTFVKDVMKDHYFRQTPGKPGVYMIPFYDLEPISRLPDDFLEEDDTSEEYNHNH